MEAIPGFADVAVYTTNPAHAGIAIHVLLGLKIPARPGISKPSMLMSYSNLKPAIGVQTVPAKDSMGTSEMDVCIII